MINRNLINRFIPITPEERDILNGNDTVNSSIYTEDSGNVIRSEKFLDKAEFIAIRPHTRFIRFPEHTHDFIEAVYMCSGETTNIINGEKILLKEGELLFLGQNARQEILCASENDIAVNFIILPDFLDKALEMLGDCNNTVKEFLLDTVYNKQNSGYLHCRVADVLPIQNLIENLICSLSDRSKVLPDIPKATMGLLFMQLLGCSDRLSLSAIPNTLTQQVIKYIDGHYKGCSLTDVSKQLHYNLYWLSHEIKNLTGKTYTELLQDKRLSQAAFLLRDTALSIEEISNAVGYENKSYFYRLFNTRFGMSPKSFREKNSMNNFCGSRASAD